MVKINVTKYSGETEEFDEEKLRQSLLRAGAEKNVIKAIIQSVHDLLYDGITTHKIYREAYRQLKKYSERTVGRYKLKEAIMELGPSGYPFERFIAELLNRKGYKTAVGGFVEGKCASHEIDVIAEKDNEHLMIECKFHNNKSNKCDIKIPLYIQSRFKDIEHRWKNLPGHENKVHMGWVVTNTRFTTDALEYGTCAGLKMLSWDYPRNNSLRELVGRLKLYPVTTIPSLSKKDKNLLLEHDIVLCQDLIDNQNTLIETGINSAKFDRILNEAKSICNN